ncbi:hypothetical protein HDU98_001176 [Podochytrium sp. JEL0797]|nr:hypothetical protein HDU98_001176 [Podochytrium sp. JEL0797]
MAEPEKQTKWQTRINNRLRGEKRILILFLSTISGTGTTPVVKIAYGGTVTENQISEVPLHATPRSPLVDPTQNPPPPSSKPRVPLKETVSAPKPCKSKRKKFSFKDEGPPQSESTQKEPSRAASTAARRKSKVVTASALKPATRGSESTHAATDSNTYSEVSANTDMNDESTHESEEIPPAPPTKAPAKRAKFTIHEIPAFTGTRGGPRAAAVAAQKEDAVTVKQEPEFYWDHDIPANRYAPELTLQCGGFERRIGVDDFVETVMKSLGRSAGRGVGVRGRRQHLMDSLFG